MSEFYQTFREDITPILQKISSRAEKKRDFHQFILEHQFNLDKECVKDIKKKKIYTNLSIKHRCKSQTK